MANETTKKSTVFGNRVVFEFRMHKAFDYSHLYLFLREESDSAFHHFYSGWQSDVSVASQIDRDTKKVYAAGLKAEINLERVERVSKAFLTISRNVRKYLEKNPRPLTFGQYTFMLAKACGITEVVFEEYTQNEGKDRFYRLPLKEACAYIDSKVSQNFPHITEPIDYGYLQ